MANPNLQKIIKLTSSQYDLLSNGGSITHQDITYTGLNDNYLYLIQEDSPDVPVVTSADKGKYLYTNASTGALEWTNVLRGSAATITATDSNPAKLTLKGKSNSSYHPGGVTLQTSSTDSTTANTITVPAKNGTMALTSDLDNYVKLTGDQSINGHKSFTVLSAKYLNGGVINTHPEASGAPAILGYYTNDLVNLHQKGGSCYIKNLTTGDIISESTPYNLFDASPTYYAFSAAQTDVVEIIIKSPVVYNWVTRGGIGFGNTQWGAKDIKIEVGYSPTGTGTAKNIDTDITWATKFNATNNWNEIIFTDLTGPDKANGGTDSNSWNYLKFTLTNFRHTTIRRIAQIFTFNSGSSGLLQTFLASAGGTLYGGITPYRTNSYWLGTLDKQWAKIYGTEIYGGYIKSGRDLEGVLRSNSSGRMANANDVPHYDNNNNATNGKNRLRIDEATSNMTSNKPASDGFIYTNMWDAGNFDTQLFLPIGSSVGNVRPSLRGCNNGTWGSWTSLAYTSDLDNYTKKSIKLSDNVDLDTVTESGFYRLMNHTQAHFPHGQMIVSRGADTIAQMVFPWNATKMFVRTGNGIGTSSESSGNWRDWKEVAFRDDLYNGILTLNTNGTGISGSATFGANQSGNSTFTVTLDSSTAGNRGANKVVLAKADGQIDSDKFTVTSAGTTKATMQYNSTEDCIEFIFA